MLFYLCSSVSIRGSVVSVFVRSSAARISSMTSSVGAREEKDQVIAGQKAAVPKMRCSGLA
ncbi:MAG: hypothetical protein R2851_26055 [Caldilineaceae bacterium]